jgi:hypothetical protein
MGRVRQSKSNHHSGGKSLCIFLPACFAAVVAWFLGNLRDFVAINTDDWRWVCDWIGFTVLLAAALLTVFLLFYWWRQLYMAAKLVAGILLFLFVLWLGVGLAIGQD